MSEEALLKSFEARLYVASGNSSSTQATETKFWIFGSKFGICEQSEPRVISSKIEFSTFFSRETTGLTISIYTIGRGTVSS